MQGALTTESYAYDQVGNRVSSLGQSPYTYNVFQRTADDARGWLHLRRERQHVEQDGRERNHDIGSPTRRKGPLTLPLRPRPGTNLRADRVGS